MFRFGAHELNGIEAGRIAAQPGKVPRQPVFHQRAEDAEVIFERDCVRRAGYGERAIPRENQDIVALPAERVRRSMFRAKAVQRLLVIGDLAGFKLHFGDFQRKCIQEDWQNSILFSVNARAFFGASNA